MVAFSWYWERCSRASASRAAEVRVASRTEVRLILLGEVPLQPVRSLDEPVIVPVEADQWHGQPSPHRGMAGLLGTEVTPLRVGPEFLVGQPDRPLDLVAYAWMPNPLAGWW